MFSIAIIDTVGLVYDGKTLSKRGLGGSESAVILISKELAKIGIRVTVFNNCQDSTSSPGVYDGVTYKPFDISLIDQYDILISSRTTTPFCNYDEYHSFYNVPYTYEFIEKLRDSSKFKILWLHDTFCIGDQFLEDMVIQGRIDELFTLSDFHTSYITTCSHGKKRNFEVLKRKIFQTRNGMTLYKNWVDIKQKDKNLFVYNASVTKGMIPLVTKIWPEVHKHIPEAKLKVIGGFYRFRDGAPPDKQEEDWHLLRAEYEAMNIGIEFTGIIPQSEIAEILTKASFFLYPGAFPETFGISMLESMAYNTPLITCRFGAMEEVAIENANYLIDYPIEPNNLFPDINGDEQINKFIDQVLRAYNDTYLHQQKMYYCNIIKDVCTWDTVAYQWKQHFYNKFKEYLPLEDYYRAQDINNKIHKIYGRRMSNIEEFTVRKTKENRILVITPFYNCEEYINRCIRSIASQDYYNYKVILIDDCSTDNTVNVVENELASLHEDIRSKFVFMKNSRNVGAVCNQISTIKLHGMDDDIVMFIDGDDALANDPNIFNMYNNMFNEGTEFSYGSCWSLVDDIPLVAQPYPPEIKEKRAYRDYKFNWGMPYTHLRAFRKYLLNDIPDEAFKDENGSWYMAGGDNATFYNIIEKANPEKISVVNSIVYLYNDTNPLNDYKVHSEEQTNNVEKIVNVKEKPMKNFNTELMVNNELIDGIGPWYQRTIDLGSWEWPKRDWETHIRDGILNRVKNRRVVVQAGGNMGMYPRLLAEHFERVYTFEPDPLNFHCLSLNCDKENIYKMQAALGAYNKLIDVEPIQENNSGVIFVRNGNKIPMITIDSLELDQCDLIQLDIEQYEPYAIMGAIRTIEKFKPVITIEGPEVTRNLCNHILAELGYEAVDRLANDTMFVHTNFKPQPMHYVSVNQSEEVYETNPKRILVAIPTARYIEPDTFKSIYDLEIPKGYTVQYQHFYGYNVDQVRNLIADWTVKGFDYLFSVDHDIVFPPDTLKKLLSHDKDVVSGLYIQRIPGAHNLEIFGHNNRIEYSDIKDKGLVEVSGCGFGCVLVKSEVFKQVGYPQFEYHSALDHKDTKSEDTDFCLKAKQKGFGIWADTSIKCEHIGSTRFVVNENIERTITKEQQRIIDISNEPRLPQQHIDFLHKIKEINPKVIYDLGSCALNWTKVAKTVWPDAKYYCFDAIPEAIPLYEQSGLAGYHIGVLSDKDDRVVEFYKNFDHPGGNSYYKENPEVNPHCEGMYETKETLRTRTVDSIASEKKFLVPDLIKIDVQGSELDVLKGSQFILNYAKHLIVELQHTEYNKGAPNRKEVIDYLESIGFRFIENFAMTPFDGDYYFVKN